MAASKEAKLTIRIITISAIRTAGDSRPAAARHCLRQRPWGTSFENQSCPRFLACKLISTYSWCHHEQEPKPSGLWWRSWRTQTRLSGHWSRIRTTSVEPPPEYGSFEGTPRPSSTGGEGRHARFSEQGSNVPDRHQENQPQPRGQRQDTSL